MKILITIILLSQTTTVKADIFTIPNFVNTAIYTGIISKEDALHNVKVYKTWVLDLYRATEEINKNKNVAGNWKKIKALNTRFENSFSEQMSGLSYLASYIPTEIGSAIERSKNGEKTKNANEVSRAAKRANTELLHVEKAIQ